MYISICLVIRDGEKYMEYIDRFFKNYEKLYPDDKLEFFIYENNSTDNTKSLIKKFYKNRKGKYICEDLYNNKMKSGRSKERGNHMAEIRNKLKKHHGILTSDYTLIFDCDVVFLPFTIKQLIETLEYNSDFAIASTFNICWNVYKYPWHLKWDNNTSLINRCHYYDSFALLFNGCSYFSETTNCPLESCKHCITWRKKNLPKEILLDMTKINIAETAFGCISLIRTDIYNKVNWGSSICEHHSFCEQVSKYGKVAINPKIKTFTTQPSKRDYESIEKELLKLKPYFILNIS